jgi:hypothetical protein
LHLTNRLHRDLDPVQAQQLLRRQRRAKIHVFVPQKGHHLRPPHIVQAPVRRAAALARHKARVAVLSPCSNQALELADTDPQTFGCLTLTDARFHERTHQMQTFSFIRTHFQKTSGHLTPARPRGQKGTF